MGSDVNGLLPLLLLLPFFPFSRWLFLRAMGEVCLEPPLVQLGCFPPFRACKRCSFGGIIISNLCSHVFHAYLCTILHRTNIYCLWYTFNHLIAFYLQIKTVANYTQQCSESVFCEGPDSGELRLWGPWGHWGGLLNSTYITQQQPEKFTDKHRLRVRFACCYSLLTLIYRNVIALRGGDTSKAAKRDSNRLEN